MTQWAAATGRAEPVSAPTADEALARLVEFVPPPAGPYAVDWQEVTAELGASPPSDFRMLCEAYGPGEFDDAIILAFPRRGYPLDLVAYGLAVAEMHRRKFRDIFSPTDPGTYPVFPEPEGALAWGRTDTQLTLTWRTTGEPDDWTVAVIDEQSAYPEFWEYGGGVAQFVLDLITGAVVVPALEDAGYEPRDQPRFALLG